MRTRLITTVRRVIFMILITLVLATPSFAADNPDLLNDLTKKILDKVEVSVGSVLAKGEKDS